MTFHPRARVRNSAGLIIEDVEFEPVAAEPHLGCDGCVFGAANAGNVEGCYLHACLPCQFPKDHALHLRRAIWVRKTT